MNSRQQITTLEDSTVTLKILQYHTTLATAAETAHIILLRADLVCNLH